LEFIEITHEKNFINFQTNNKRPDNTIPLRSTTLILNPAIQDITHGFKKLENLVHFIHNIVPITCAEIRNLETRNCIMHEQQYDHNFVHSLELKHLTLNWQYD